MLKVFLLSNKRKRSPGSRPREISRTSIFVALEDTTFFTYLFIYLHNFYQFYLIIYLFTLALEDSLILRYNSAL